MKDVSNNVSNFNCALKQWMEENEWWKDACRDAAVFARGGDIFTKYPPIYKTIDIKIANDESRNQWNDALATNASNLVDLCFEGGPLGRRYTTVLAVDNINLMNHSKEMTWDQVEDAVLKEGDKKFRVMRKTFASFFNPAFGY